MWSLQTPEFIEKVQTLHQANRFVDTSLQELCSLLRMFDCRGMNPADCDRRFLELACRLERYGMDFHLITVWTPVTVVYSDLVSDLLSFSLLATRMCLV